MQGREKGKEKRGVPPLLLIKKHFPFSADYLFSISRTTSTERLSLSVAVGKSG